MKIDLRNRVHAFLRGQPARDALAMDVYVLRLRVDRMERENAALKRAVDALPAEVQPRERAVPVILGVPLHEIPENSTFYVSGPPGPLYRSLGMVAHTRSPRVLVENMATHKACIMNASALVIPHNLLDPA